MSSDFVYRELELVIDAENLINGAFKVVKQLRQNWLFDRMKFQVRIQNYSSKIWSSLIESEQVSTYLQI